MRVTTLTLRRTLTLKRTACVSPAQTYSHARMKMSGRDAGDPEENYAARTSRPLGVAR
jgi:hypothetical protein